MRNEPANPDVVVAGLAARQHGVVPVPQLRAAPRQTPPPRRSPAANSSGCSSRSAAVAAFRPLRPMRVGTHEVDFLWRGLSLIVEADGFRYHGGRAAFESDRARDMHLQALGYTALRFTYRQLRQGPGAVVGSLREVMRRQEPPGADRDPR